MSFYINNTALKSAFFNGSEVKSIYYKGVNVWEAPKFTWVGWNNATWEDIYNLCKAKQDGTITEWPSDIGYASTWKTVNLSSSVLGTTSLMMYVAGLDIDGDGVITFVAGDALNNTASRGGNWNASNSLRSGALTDFYNACEAKPYIKKLNKQTENSKGTLFTTEDYVWIPSVAELGLEYWESDHLGEYTEGVSTPYPHFDRAVKLERYPANSSTEISYYLRSKQPGTSNMYSYGPDGLTKVTPTTTHYVVPAFAIG